MRRADPDSICETGGLQYNRRYEVSSATLPAISIRAFALHSGVDPYAGDLWESAAGSSDQRARRWPGPTGNLDFADIEVPGFVRC